MIRCVVKTGGAAATAVWRAGRRSRPWSAALVMATLFSCGVPAFAQPQTAPAQDINEDKNDFTPAGVPEEKLTDIDLINLDVPEVDVVETAARRKQRVKDLPYAVSIVTAEDIRRSGARSVPDALRLVPGMDVADLSWAHSAVSARGFHGLTADQVLVLMDGRQMFDPILGATFWNFWPIQLEDIERIEVLRGPTGVTWGANAMNGVVNIVTKDPARQTGLTTVNNGGSRGWNKEHLGYGYADEKLKLRASGEYEGSEGFRKGGGLLNPLDDDYKAGRTGVHAIFEPGFKDTVTLSAGSSVVDGGNPVTPGAGIGASSNASSESEFLLGKWDHRIASDNQIGITGYVNDFFLSPSLKAIDYRYQQLALEVTHTFKPADNHTLTWGIDSRTDLIDASNSDPIMLTRDFVSSATIGLYAQDEWKFAPKWSLNLGGRIDYEFYGGFQPSGRISLAHEFDDGSFAYGAVSRAFQMPPVGGRFSHFPLYNGLTYVTADPDTEAQNVIAYELGYRKKFFDKLATNINLFWNDFSDVITISPEAGPPGLIQQEYDNRAAANMYGVELDTRWTLTRQLTLLGNYTYQQLDWQASVPFTDKDFMTPPKHKFMLGAQYDPLKDLHLSSYLYYVDAVRAPNAENAFKPLHVHPYFRLDMRAEYEFWKKQAAVAVGVRNLLDPEHLEGGTAFLNTAEVPRMVYAEFRLTLK
jgi:iron complex outermembrane recepter protein